MRILGRAQRARAANRAANARTRALSPLQPASPNPMHKHQTTTHKHQTPTCKHRKTTTQTSLAPGHAGRRDQRAPKFRRRYAALVAAGGARSQPRPRHGESAPGAHSAQRAQSVVGCRCRRRARPLCLPPPPPFVHSPVCAAASAPPLARVSPPPTHAKNPTTQQQPTTRMLSRARSPPSSAKTRGAATSSSTKTASGAGSPTRSTRRPSTCST